MDDLAYVSKDQAETSVLFELISARYELRSLLVTANHPFGEWNRIFPDAAMTLAAVDRLVHHGTMAPSSNSTPKATAGAPPSRRGAPPAGPLRAPRLPTPRPPSATARAPRNDHSHVPTHHTPHAFRFSS